MQKREQIVKDYFDKTDNYLRDNLVISLRTKLIKDKLPFLSKKSILDIGCGNGDLTLPYIKENYITFLDISEKMLEIVRSKIQLEYSNNAKLININLDNYSELNRYDYIFAIGILAHLTSIEKSFSKFSVLLNTEGILIIQFTNSRNLISLIIRMISVIKKIFGKGVNYNVNYTSKRKIFKELEKNNLRCFNIESYWPALPGFSFLPIKVMRIIYYRVLNNKLIKTFGGELILFIKKEKV
jgi:cyclopropane fatty-acyl-phospholipid synthase-like methyltransferase